MLDTLIRPGNEVDDDDGPVLFCHASAGSDTQLGQVWEDADDLRARFVRQFGYPPEEIMAVTSVDMEVGAFVGYIVWEADDGGSDLG